MSDEPPDEIFTDEEHIAWVEQLRDTPVSRELQPSENIFERMLSEAHTSIVPDTQVDSPGRTSIQEREES